MPTFLFSSSNVVASSSLAPTVAPKKKSRTTKKPVNDAATDQSNVIHSETTTCVPVDEPKIEEHTEQEVQQEGQAPTFPDIVILKQTDKNYIVKHNNYPISTSEKNPNEYATNKMNSKTNETEPFLQTSDLVSPNQIYKGQINKKRGRKPKAGFILNSNTGNYDTSQVPNIILHLKCHLSDLKTNDYISNYDYTPSISEVESYNLSTNILQSSDICPTYNEDYHEVIEEDTDTIQHNMYPPAQLSAVASVSAAAAAAVRVSAHPPADALTAPTTSTAGVAPYVKKSATDTTVQVLNERHQKEIMKKINRLKYSFHNGETIQMKLNHKCACFWDTCEFDGPIYYLPIMIVNGVFHVSGCFCSPECALAALLKEQLDTSSKFERIHLLHLLYGSSSNKGFKPAPNPNYLLDKYYGNLTIEEYRSLLKSPQMIHIVNKPLTHILPELYEDNNDFLVNSKVIPTNTLKLKKRYKTMVVQGGSE